MEVKGRKSGGYKALVVVLWFGGEIAGFILGTAMAGGDPSARLLPYFVALAGAVVGASIAYTIANNVAPEASTLSAESPSAELKG